MKPRLSSIATMAALCATPLFSEVQAQETAKLQPKLDRPSILAIVAHPDDELTIAPALARAARDGSPVTLIFATSGDAGPGSSGLEPGEALADLRESEARCAAFALGVPDPVFWKMGDGTLSDMPRGADSPAKRLTSMVRDAIAETEPSVVMTFGPDGGYGHGDHRMVSAVVTQVVQSLGAGRPDLLYAAIPGDVDMGVDELGELADPTLEGWATTHPDLITDRLRYEPVDLDATRGAVRCYESQFAPQVRAGLADLLHAEVWKGQVHFRLAFANRF